MIEQLDKKGIVNYFLDRDILLSPEILDQEMYSIKNIEIPKNLLVVDKNLYQNIEHLPTDFNFYDFDKSRFLLEKNNETKSYNHCIEYILENLKQRSPIKVIKSYDPNLKRHNFDDFVLYFKARFEKIRGLLMRRSELASPVSIDRIKAKKDKGNLVLIGMVNEKNETPNGNIMITLEDFTGSIKILFSKNKPDLFRLAQDIVLDEIIGVDGVNGENIIFANNLFLPDMPLDKNLKKIDEEIYAAFLSDIHVGSHEFLENDFLSFIDWLNGEKGNDAQKELASKIKYCFIMGDLVDGVGIYPGQEKDLKIKDIYKQYERAAELFRLFPKHINIVLSPGNHDAMRIAEPQPCFYEDISKPLYTLPNVTIVSNPAVVNIESKEGFEGFNILLYHGYSFDYYVQNVDSIRKNGGYDRADLIMKFLLQRRHLAPSHQSTVYIPIIDEDPLVIDILPDIFATGHIHKCSVSNYKNVTLLSGSCWQGKTAFQEKVGHNPEPGRVPIINLKTRAVKILKFLS